MILITLQIVVLACLGYYLYRWRKAVSRRNAQSWNSLLARLRPDFAGNDLALGVERPLAGDEDESVGFDCLRIRADGLRSVFSRDNFAHKVFAD